MYITRSSLLSGWGSRWKEQMQIVQTFVSPGPWGRGVGGLDALPPPEPQVGPRWAGERAGGVVCLCCELCQDWNTCGWNFN